MIVTIHGDRCFRFPVLHHDFESVRDYAGSPRCSFHLSAHRVRADSHARSDNRKGGQQTELAFTSTRHGVEVLANEIETCLRNRGGRDESESECHVLFFCTPCCQRHPKSACPRRLHGPTRPQPDCRWSLSLASNAAEREPPSPSGGWSVPPKNKLTTAPVFGFSIQRTLRLVSRPVPLVPIAHLTTGSGIQPVHFLGLLANADRQDASI